MIGFKDALAKDVKSVFINGQEFADAHMIDGVEVLCVVDSDIIAERESQIRSESVEGVFASKKMIFVDENDLPSVPVRGQRLSLDGEWYFVNDVDISAGILQITIEANEQ